jgi:putative transport protein
MEQLFDPDFYASLLFQEGYSYVALFVIVAFGFLIGNLEVRGFSLGVSAILFVAMVFGHLGVRLPSIIQDIGLVLFLFTVGIQAGPGFFDSLRKHGKSLALLATAGVVAGILVTWACSRLFGFNLAMAAGLMGGALTSTPALATAAEMFPAGDVSIAYGISYPFGVVGVILFLKFLPRILRVDMSRAERAYNDSLMADFPEVRAGHLEVKK